MSVISTESWMAFLAHNGDDALSAPNTAMRAAITKALQTAAYEVYRDNTNAAWIVRPHPVVPGRQALVFSAPAGAIAQYGIRKRVGDNVSAIIGGFSLFIPSSFIPDTTGRSSSSPYPFMVVLAGAIGSAMNKMVANGEVVITDEIFRVRYDLKIGYGSELQSSRAITPGKLAYLEYRVSPTEIRVWLDDILVLQKSVARNNQTIGISTVSWTPSTGGYSPMAGDTGRWAIADWYNLAEDAVTPNVRLGPATRVIGTRASSDSFAQFQRPPAFASNAAVVAQGLNVDTTNFLKTDTVGAQDVYNGVEDEATAGSALVHAVNLKVIAQNIEAAPHTMIPQLVSNGVAQGTPVALPGTLGLINTVSTVDPNTGAAWTPAAAAASKFGMKLNS